jgi:hypothetical protein
MHCRASEGAPDLRENLQDGQPAKLTLSVVKID